MNNIYIYIYIYINNDIYDLVAGVFFLHANASCVFTLKHHDNCGYCTALELAQSSVYVVLSIREII